MLADLHSQSCSELLLSDKDDFLLCDCRPKRFFFFFPPPLQQNLPRCTVLLV